MIINTKADLDALRGTDAYAEALRRILGATTMWVNDAPAGSPPVWRQQSVGDTLARFGLTTEELMDECAAAGVVPQTPEAPPAAAVDLNAYVMVRRDELIDGGFSFGGVDYQSRATDRENILGASLLASLAIAAGAQPGNYRWDPDRPSEDFEWIALDNTKVKMDAATVIAFGKAQAARKQELIFKARAIKDQIAAGTITTTAQIDAAFA